MRDEIELIFLLMAHYILTEHVTSNVRIHAQIGIMPSTVVG